MKKAGQPLFTKKIIQQQFSDLHFDKAKPFETNLKVFLAYKNAFNIDINDNLLYRAFPLYANGRFIGLLRTLVNYDVLGRKPYYHSGIHNLAKIIGGILGNYYPRFGYSVETLPKIDVSSNSFIGKNIYNELCEALRYRINCRAFLIRVGDDLTSGPYLKGWTSTIENYAKEIQSKDHFISHFQELQKIFEIANKHLNERIRFLGFKFSVSPDGIRDIRYITSYEGDTISWNESIKIKNVPDFQTDVIGVINRLFDENIVSKLLQQDLNECVLIRIPHIFNGYVTFANTKNRHFIRQDIEQIYPQINRVGSEWAIGQKYHSEQENQVLKHFYESWVEKSHSIIPSIQEMLLQTVQMNQLCTQLGNVIEDNESPVISSTITNIGLKLIRFKEKLDELNNEMLGTKPADFSDNPFLNIQYNLADYIDDEIRSLIPDENTYAFRTKFDNTVFVNFRPSFIKSILKELVDNARKYSYSYDYRRDNKIAFVKTDFSYIDIALEKDSNQVRLSVTSWGPLILKDEQEDVFKAGRIGTIVGGFIPPINRTGQGLAFAKHYALKLQGNLYYTIINNANVFIFSWLTI